MALLEITAISTSSTGASVPVRVELTDARGAPIYGFSNEGVFVLPQVARTDDTGFVAFELTPNVDISADVATFYTIHIGDRSYLILKSGATQTVFEALATTPDGIVMSFLTSENNLSDLSDSAEARDNIGLGDSATRDIGTVAGTVAAGDDPRFISNTDHNLLDNRDEFPAHPAAAVEFTPYLGIVGTDVQTAIEEVYNAAIISLDDADEINFAPTGSISSTDVQAAIVEVQGDAQQGIDHIADPLNAHAASAISYTPSSPFTQGNVQGAFDELFGLIAATPIDRIGLNAGTDVATARVTGDPFPRFILNADGKLEWGPGASSFDTNLYRESANVLRTDDSLVIAGNNLGPAATSGSLRMVNTASIQFRNAANSANVIGLAVDANDDTFLNANSTDSVHLSLQGVPRATVNSSQFGIRAATNTLVVSSTTDPTTAAGGIFFGVSLDTNLYRSAANSLKTDDAFSSAVSVSAPFTATGTTPATTGNSRHSNDGQIVFRNFANTVDITALNVNTSNNTVVNSTTGQSVQLTVNGTAVVDVSSTLVTHSQPITSGSNVSSTGQVRLPNNTRVSFRNAANSGDIGAFLVGTLDNTQVNAITGKSVFLNVNDVTQVAVAAGNVTLTDAVNITVGTTTGTKIAVTTSGKLGFWGATPVVRPSTTGEVNGRTAGGGGTVSSTDTFTGNVGATAYTLHDIVKHLKNIGLIAP